MPRPFLTALAAVCLLSYAARADPLSLDEVRWTYDFSPSTPFLAANGGPGGGVSFSDEPAGAVVGSRRGVDVFATTLRAVSTAPPNNPDTLSAAGYTLTLTLSSVTQNQVYSANLSFSGALRGVFYSGDARIHNTFGPDARQFVRLGPDLFTVDLIEYFPPGMAYPGVIPRDGYLMAHIEARSPLVIGPLTPEPSSAVLAALSLVGAAVWGRRRREGQGAGVIA